MPGFAEVGHTHICLIQKKMLFKKKLFDNNQNNISNQL